MAVLMPARTFTICLVLVVGHTNCGGVDHCLKAVREDILPDPTTPLERWLAPLTALVRTLDLEGVPDSEALTIIAKESVRAQVEKVAHTTPVQEAWAGRRKLWVHGLIYELETGTLKNLNFSRGPPA